MQVDLNQNPAASPHGAGPNERSWEHAMKGYQVSFYTVESRTLQGKPVGHWLVDLAKALKIDGATMTMGVEGLGRGGRLHSAHFLEIADQPVEVTMAVSETQCDRLFEILRRERANVFYMKVPVEYGIVGGVDG